MYITRHESWLSENTKEGLATKKKTREIKYRMKRKGNNQGKLVLKDRVIWKNRTIFKIQEIYKFENMNL